MIAPEQAQQLYQAAGEPRELALLPGAGHRLRLDERAVTTSLAWLRLRAGLEP
ncbi:MAG: hypothetical protein HY676_05845 [Chloroflexi bacterium]|nr:hypothetical protein [Chloroflexota bacterium]